MKLRTLSATFITLLSAGTVCAAPVGKADALSSARKFFDDHGLRANFNNSNPTRSLSDSNQPAPYHIFNIENNGGYIIIAGDDRAKTVLAYSLQGNLNENTLPEACKAWLSQYAEEIQSIPQDYNPIHSASEAPTTSVPPLLKSLWNQTNPYNLETPLAPDGSHYPTGCVATSVAQIMYYYNYPEKGTGSVTYENMTDSTLHTIDFSNYPAFDWINMTDTYTSASSTKSSNAVASLMKAVGYASMMQYNATSTALHSNAAKALINNFGYDPNIHYYHRIQMTDNDWMDIIISELIEGRPVLYEGRNPAGGHSFLCDGYDGSGYFHFNWGWGGLSDGYYSLSALNPPNQSAGGTDCGYSLSQNIMCRIAPPGKIESKPQTDYILELYGIYFRSEQGFPNSADVDEWVSDPKEAQLYIYAYNKAIPDFTGEVCAVSIEDGKITPVLTRDITDLEVHKYQGISFPISETTLSEGTHRIGFFYRKDSGDSWHKITSSVTYPSECTVKIESDKVTMSVNVPEVSLEMASTLTHSPLQINSDYTWNFTLENTGNIRFEGYAGVALSNVEEGNAYYMETPFMLIPGGRSEIEIKGCFRNLQEGEYIAIPFYSYSSNPDMTNIIPLARPERVILNPLTIVPSHGSYFLLESAEKPLTLTLLNMGRKVWEGVIKGDIIKSDGTIAGTFSSPEIRVEPGQNLQTTLQGRDIDVTRGNHTMNLYEGSCRQNLLTTVPLIAMTDIAGVDSIEVKAPTVSASEGTIRISSESSMALISLYDTSGSLCRNISNLSREVEIDSSSLPAGIYILKIIATDGKSTAMKIKL